MQRHGDTDVWLNPPPIPLETKEMDWVYELAYQRKPHPLYGDASIPAYKIIRFSVAIQRGCFGGCTFCSITEHEGRIIQSRSEDSVIHEVERVRDRVPGFTGVISDLGGPTANMYRIACKSREIEAACRRPSCVFPGVCPNLDTNHAPLIELYRKARALPGVKKVLIASGVRYDLAIESPEYVKELAQHHVGGYLKIAPEHVREGLELDAAPRASRPPPRMPNIGEAFERPYQRADLIASDVEYGRVVCFCERVTEGELRGALSSPVPPADLDGLRRRTRAHMGRCQGFFCGARLAAMLAEREAAARG